MTAFGRLYRCRAVNRSPLVSIGTALLLSVVASGCGQSASEKRDLATARSIVHRFSEASDASACGLLTNKAVRALYGQFKTPPGRSRANCAKRARSFRGAPVDITRAELLDPRTIKVNAADKDGKFTYQVNLRKGPTGRWRIDLVTQAKPTTF
jgi:hypothetical protein